VRYGRLTASGLKQGAAIISGAQPAQAELRGSEVIDTGFQAGQVAANQIELNLVERPGAGGSSKVNFATGVFPPTGDARGKVEDNS
jgi:hypothetical protein